MATGEERYEQAVQILMDSLKFGIHPSLDGINALMELLGDPHTKYPAIQVAGTNGKTSTVRQIAGLLRAHGYRTGLYSSPHLVEYPERIEIDGVVVGHEQYADAVLRAKDAADHLAVQGITITEFELGTAAAFQIFAEENVDVAVLECGMGGRWDTTSIVESGVGVVTGIGLDHIGILGDTVEDIAFEKAGVIKPGRKVVLGPGTQGTLPVFLSRCEEVGVEPWLVRSRLDVADCIDDMEAEMPSANGSPLAGTVLYDAGYAGNEATIDVDVEGCFESYGDIIMEAPLYQAQNISTAIAATELYMGHPLDPDKVRHVMAHFAIPGRFETLIEEPALIIDAAHNPQSALNLATAIAHRFPKGDFLLLLAVLADKDADGIIDVLAGFTPDIAVTQTSSHRALSRFDLADKVEAKTGTRPEIFDTPAAALDELLARQVNVIASGSITLAGEVKAAWLERTRKGKSLL